MIPDRYKGKTTIVTGGASGIGMAISKRFAGEDASVEILDVDEKQLDVVTREIAETGGDVHGSVCDVTDANAVDQVISEIQQRRGRIDVLVNNAGIAHVGNAVTTTAADFERVQRVNVFGPANCMRSALKFMTQSDGGGVILNVASTVAFMGIPDRFAYSTSKGAVLAMTYATARDFVDQGIRVNAILPGRVHTPFVDGFISKNYPGQEAEMFAKLEAFQPIGRMGTTEEIAAAVSFLCCDEASFVTGSAIPVDGGTLSIR